MGLTAQIIINPAQCSFIIVSGKTISGKEVHLGKGQDSQPTSTVLRKYYATTVRGALKKDCVKLAKEKSRDKQKNTEVARQYKNKLRDTVQRGNITVNEVSFARVPDTTFYMEQMERLLGNLQLDESD